MARKGVLKRPNTPGTMGVFYLTRADPAERVASFKERLGTETGSCSFFFCRSIRSIISRMEKRTVIQMLKTGAIGVLPTDTIYGVVGSALNKRVVERIYKLRDRNPRKPMIVLIGALTDLKRFGVRLTPELKKMTARLWPGKISIIFKCRSKRMEYLHRGTRTLAFRLPAKNSLRMLLGKTGPLVAPSANPEGKPPARTIHEAKRYFKKKVDFYVDGGRQITRPSKLIAIVGGESVILRE